MNIWDEIIIFILHVFDFAMDLVTLGGWSRWQGQRMVDFKVKEK